MSAAARYDEHPLPEALRGWVEAVWSVTLDAQAPAVAHRVVPDGCIDLVQMPGQVPVVAGPATAASLVAMAPGTTIHGLRFRPGAAPFVLGVGADELLDRTVPLAGLLGRRAVPEAELSPAELQRLAVGRLRGGDPLVDAAVARLTDAPQVSVATLAGELFVSERQLRRRFHDAVGYGPKRLARILRLQRLLTQARARCDTGGAWLAAAAGYVDEAHMGREVRALAGTPAQTLLRERGRSVQAWAAGSGQAG